MREKMRVSERAKQFLPFSAVRGLDEALEKKRKELLKEERVYLMPEREEEINAILLSLEEGDKIRVEFYDENRYKEVVDIYKRNRYKEGRVETENFSIPFRDILSLSVLKREEEL